MDERDAYAAAHHFFAEMLMRRLMAGDIVRAMDPFDGDELCIEVLCGGKESHSLRLWRRAGANHRLDGGFGQRVTDRLPSWVVSEKNTILAAFSFDADEADN